MVVWSQQLPREIKKIELLVTSKEKNIGWNLLRREIVFVFSLLYSWYIHSPLLSLSPSLFDREVNEQSSALDERREREFLGGAYAFWQRVNRTNPRWAEWAQRIQRIHISIQNCIELEVPSTAHKRRKPGGGHHQPSAFILWHCSCWVRFLLRETVYLMALSTCFGIRDWIVILSPTSPPVCDIRNIISSRCSSNPSMLKQDAHSN